MSTSSRPAGAARARLADVAAAAGVSKGTASRILNGDQRLSAQQTTRERVFEAARTLGYRPHSGARALATARTMTIALVTPALDNPPYVAIARGAFARAEQRDYLALLLEDTPAAPVGATLVTGGRVDGVMMGSASRAHPFLPTLATSGMAHVFVNRAVPGSGRNVTMDVDAASALAVAYLADRGHRRVMHLAGPRDIVPSAERAHAFANAVAGRGLPALPAVHTEFTEAAAEAALDALLAENPSAVFTSSLAQAIGLLHGCRQRGIDVPRDLSVLAYDDFPVAGFTLPALSTVRMPLEELGRAAVDALLNQLEGGESEDVLVATAPQLIERASVAGPR